MRRRVREAKNDHFYIDGGLFECLPVLKAAQRLGKKHGFERAVGAAVILVSHHFSRRWAFTKTSCRYAGITPATLAVMVECGVVDITEGRYVLTDAVMRWVRARRAGVRRLLDELIARQGTACAYCQRALTEDEMHVDHIVAIARGGTNAISNLAIACEGCNSAKGTRTAEEFTAPRLFPRGVSNG